MRKPWIISKWYSILTGRSQFLSLFLFLVFLLGSLLPELIVDHCLNFQNHTVIKKEEINLTTGINKDPI